ncbi:hypothetical protein FRC04_004892 [Tulasnella sp. 424]|nr:hypothetical protein FRC04_004892 [Tulasnella sp. 424]KAG8975665.1 hypothetical protein FRC05_005183 [Tulasnella sp. 425]
MAPLSQANKMFCLAHNSEDGSKLYEGFADPEWAFKRVTYGGFSLSAILDAALQFQSKTPHPDPIRLESEFLRAVTPAIFQVRIRPVQAGEQSANLTAELWQGGILKIMCHLVFTNFDVLSESRSVPTLPETRSPSHPLPTHPSQAPLLDRLWAPKIYERYSWAREPSSVERSSLAIIKGGRTPTSNGMTSGAWIELHEKPEVEMSASWIPLFVDMTETTWKLLPKDVTGAVRWWPSSVFMDIEFKCRLPLPSQYAPHTLGVFTLKHHLDNRFWSDSSEVWSAPSVLADANVKVDEQWREKMVCVAVATQIASLAPVNVQTRYEGETGSSYIEQAKL